MSIQYMDGLQIYGGVTSRIVEGTPWAGFTVFDSSGLVIDPSGETTDYMLRIFGDGPTEYRMVLPASRTKVGLAQRVYLSGLPVDNDGRPVFAEMRDESNDLIYSWVISPTGRIQLIQGPPATYIDRVTVDETTSPVVGVGVKTHIEVVIDIITGEYECRVEGITVMSGTDPSPPVGFTEVGIVAWSMAWFYNETPAADKRMFIQDIILWDDQGTQNNDFIGPVTIYTLPVDGDVSSGWTPSTGTTQYTLLDELNPDDADYISASDALPAAAIFTFQDLPDDVVAVRALQTVVRARKTDGGEGQLQVSLISGMDTDLGANRPVAVSTAYYYDVSELDPATAALWIPLDVDNADIQLNRTV